MRPIITIFLFVLLSCSTTKNKEDCPEINKKMNVPCDAKVWDFVPEVIDEDECKYPSSCYFNLRR